MKSLLLKRRRAWPPVCAVALTWILSVLAVSPRLMAQQASAPALLPVIEVRPNIHVITGAGGNITAQIGSDGVVLVDSGSGERSDAVVATIKSLTDQPIRYIINTGPSPEHVGGNEALAKAGVSIFVRNGNASVNNGGAAAIIGTEGLLTRISSPDYRPVLPAMAWPTETFTRKQKEVFLNHEAIQVIQQPSAHSDGDAVVFFRRSDVLVTGDIFDVRQFPVIDVASGGTIDGEIAAVNALIELTVPSIPLVWLDEGGTRVVPGHGRIGEEAELVEYRDMLTIIRDRIRDSIGHGRSLEAIQAANPTQGFRSRYGRDTGAWTTRQFVEAVHASLTAGATR